MNQVYETLVDKGVLETLKETTIPADTYMNLMLQQIGRGREAQTLISGVLEPSIKKKTDNPDYDPERELWERKRKKKPYGKH